jgi:hypothetical protein
MKDDIHNDPRSLRRFHPVAPQKAEGRERRYSNNLDNFCKRPLTAAPAGLRPFTSR